MSIEKPRKITLTAVELRAMVKAAYLDGLDDGRSGLPPVLEEVHEQSWRDSVTESHLIHFLRKGN